MFDHTDKDGARFKIAPANSPRYGKQVYIELSASEGYVPPELAGDAAIAFLESAGVEPDELDYQTSPQLHEEEALAHLLLARELRRQIAEREALATRADALRQEFPELDPYEGITWKAMTEEGKRIHLDRLARTEKVLGDTAEGPTTPARDGEQ